jgi:ubiquinone/menaquinone biosynthesis C-methylase UbiE
MFIAETPAPREIRRAYDLWSYCYDLVAAPGEADARRRALDGVQGRRILDVGIGSGASFAGLARRASAGGVVCGMDLSRLMLRRARVRLGRQRLSPARLVEGNALRLPIRGGSFDTIVSSYLLDLLSTRDIAGALAEFYRVLRPGGRLVLVNLTKLRGDRTTWFERSYEMLPSIARAYLLGGCRPVQLEPLVTAAGFVATQRTVVRQFLSSEIVIADKPYVQNGMPRAA